MRRRDLWVGQNVGVAGIGGKWHITHIKGVWVWVKPLDNTAHQFARLGENVVGFRTRDLIPYLTPGEQL